MNQDENEKTPDAPAPDQAPASASIDDTQALAPAPETESVSASEEEPIREVAAPDEPAPTPEAIKPGAPTMRIVGLRIHSAGPLQWHILPGSLKTKIGDRVVVEVDRGLALARVVTDPAERPLSSASSYPRIVRVMDERDLQLEAENKARADQAKRRCRELIAEMRLPMRLARVEYQHSGNKAVFFFSSEGRVDFRELVRILAQDLRIRVEMRQIGIRDEAKLLGGLGPCGQPTCCCSFLSEFTPVSIRMAKEQNLTLNPEKVSGLCGRLMCCLGYESDHYCEKQKDLPKIGKKTTTWMGRGRLMEINIFTEQMRIELDDTREVVMVGLEDYKAYRLDPEGFAAKQAEKEERERKEKRRNGEGFQSRRGRPQMDRPSLAPAQQAEHEAGLVPKSERLSPDGVGTPSAPAREGEARPPRPEGQGPRPPRPDRPERPNQPRRPPRPEGQGPREERPPRPEGQGPREERRPRPEGQARPPRPERQARPDEAARPERSAPPDGEPGGEGPTGEGGERSRSRHRRRRRHPGGGGRPNGGEGAPPAPAGD